MFCENCGKKIEGDMQFCENCGNPLVKEEKKKTKSLIGALKIVLVIGMICFFMPFATVSCGNTDITVNGIEVALGNFSDNYIPSEDVGANVFLIIAIIATCISFGVCFAVKKDIGFVSSVKIFNIIALIFLFIFMLSVKPYYAFEGNDLDYIEIEYNIGFWMAVLANGISAVLAYKIEKEGVMQTEVIVDELEVKKTVICGKCKSENAPDNIFCCNCGVRLDSICKNCGEQITENAKFCTKCGTPVRE